MKSRKSWSRVKGGCAVVTDRNGDEGFHPEALIQDIDLATMKWKTICRVVDAPNPITAAMRKYHLTFCWIKHTWDEREPYVLRRGMEQARPARR